MKNKFEIRLADASDTKNVFDLSQDKTVRKDSIHRVAFSWKEHLKWFSSRIKADDCLFYVAYEEDNFLGYVRLDREKEFWNVSIHIKPSERGRGIAKEFLFEVRRQNRDKKLSALIKNSNEDIYALFLRSDFKFDGFKYVDGEKYRKMKLFPKNVIVISDEVFKGGVLYERQDVVYIEENDELAPENLFRINPKFVFFAYWSYKIPKGICENFDCVVFTVDDVPFGESSFSNLIQSDAKQIKISAIGNFGRASASEYAVKYLDISRGDESQICKRTEKIIAKIINELIAGIDAAGQKSGPKSKKERKKEPQSNLDEIMNVGQIFESIKACEESGKRAFLQNGNIKFEFNSAKMKDGKLTAKVEIREV